MQLPELHHEALVYASRAFSLVSVAGIMLANPVRARRDRGRAGAAKTP